MDDLYRESKVLAAPNLHEMIDRLAKLPLAYQPGAEFQYSLSMDIEGAIVAPAK